MAPRPAAAFVAASCVPSSCSSACGKRCRLGAVCRSPHVFSRRHRTRVPARARLDAGRIVGDDTHRAGRRTRRRTFGQVQATSKNSVTHASESSTHGVPGETVSDSRAQVLQKPSRSVVQTQLANVRVTRRKIQRWLKAVRNAGAQVSTLPLQSTFAFLSGAQVSVQLLSSANARNRNTRVEQKEIQLKNGARAVCFWPVVNDASGMGGAPDARATERSTIVLMHGIHPLGVEDGRVQKFARAFASAGFVCVMPEIEQFKAFQLDPSGIDAVGEALNRISTHKELCPSGMISVFGASMSGSMSMIAAARDAELASRIRVILCVGSFANVESASMKAMCGLPEDDDTCRNILMYNFLHFSYAELDARGEPHALPRHLRANVIEALRIAVRSRTTCNVKPLVEYLESSAPEVAEEFTRLQTDVAYRLSHVMRILPHTRSMMDEMSPIRYVDKFTFPVLLIHGYEDEVVPASEAQTMYNKLKGLADKSSTSPHLPEPTLCLTPLIGHGHRKPFRMSFVPAIAAVLSVLTKFIRLSSFTRTGTASPAPVVPAALKSVASKS
ncbi:hypothetical protein FVE85_9472 [Porphyridium purpureum]|uniref:BD-FAE-like domain-containing protein n=1 Tax=Porphyridium purpureum TaxID=35688 RepID=A0A5J4YL53_PORPP|nr:hypothetical protein FVE85_9472 [Porphyridium purpureum]|eukprot:POR6344..scf261_15